MWLYGRKKAQDLPAWHIASYPCHNHFFHSKVLELLYFYTSKICRYVWIWTDLLLNWDWRGSAIVSKLHSLFNQTVLRWFIVCKYLQICDPVSTASTWGLLCKRLIMLAFEDWNCWLTELLWGQRAAITGAHPYSASDEVNDPEMTQR